MTWRLRRLIVPMVAVLALAAASCGGDDDGGEETGGDGGAAAGEVSATLVDFSITLDPTSVPAGSVTFNVTNDAEQLHEFVVFDTDLPEDALPTDDAGDVNEAGDPDLVLVDEIEDIAPGATPSLTVDLAAGSYVLICNIPGHYAEGMHTSFTVS